MSERFPNSGESERDPVRLPIAGREPVAKRLNRNALTVAAVIMGVTVLTAVVLLNPGRPDMSEASSPMTQAPPSSVRPTFLDQPIPQPAAPQETMTTTPGSRVSPSELRWGDGRGLRSSMSHEKIGGMGDAYMPRREPSPREQAFRAALVSGVVVGAPLRSSDGETEDSPWSGAPNGPPGHQALAFSDSGVDASTLAGPLHGTLGYSVSPVAVAAPSGPAAVGGTPTLARGPRAPNGLLTATLPSGEAATTIARLVLPSSPYTLSAGTLIPGVLITGIASDLPGGIVGQTSRNVYDSRTQRILLIPKGSKLIGTYDNQVVASQSRLLVAWTRLILPDGRSMTLPGLALTDAQGRAGAEGKVDNHGRRVFGHSLLLSLISAGAQLSQPRQASVFAAPSAGQVAAGAIGQELSQVALEILRRGMSAPPTINIPAGQPFNVFLNGDMVFDGPYEAVQ